MRLKKLLDRRAGYSLASLGLLLSMAAPAAIPAFASAELLSQRSITMSTSAAGAEDVQYSIKFTTSKSIAIGGGVAVEFCANSAVVGDTCTRPAGMETSSGSLVDVVSDGASMTNDGTLDNDGPQGEEGSLLWTAAEAHSGGDELEIVVGGIANPSDIGVFYARVMTFENATQLSDYDGEEADEFGDYGDEGSIALAATGGIGVTGYVLESMIFCVSGQEPSVNCGSGEVDCTPPEVDEGCVTSPSMVLGRETYEDSGIFALVSSELSTGSVFAQLSSNASGNTVVNLKSDATGCGGLYRNGDRDECHITPQNTPASTFSAGTAKFGLRVGASSPAPLANGTPGSSLGTFQVASGSGYDSSNYFIDYVDGDATGVTSTYGSPLLETDGPVDNRNIQITFGASVTNNTPAGTYGATLSMIAVGTF